MIKDPWNAAKGAMVSWRWYATDRRSVWFMILLSNEVYGGYLQVRNPLKYPSDDAANWLLRHIEEMAAPLRGLF